MSDLSASAPAGQETLELAVGGMTCASCVARVEKRLGRVPGAHATVNLATERAVVRFDPSRATPEQLVAAVEAAGYSAAPVPDPALAGADLVGAEGSDAAALPAPDRVADLRRRLWVAVPLTVPVAVIGMVPALHAVHALLWVSLVLATPVVVWCGWPFTRAALRAARHGTSSMDTLVALGTWAAYLWSVVELLTGGMDVYLEVSTVVITFLLAGRLAEARAKRAAGGALRALLELTPATATLLDAAGGERTVPVTRLVVGSRFVVRPGERVAADGVVEEGHSSIDASLVTGESVPAEVGPGDEVVGATVNGPGRLVVRATAVGSQTAVARIGRLVSQAQASKAPVQRLADRVSAVFVPTVLGLALVTCVGWLLAGAGAPAAVTATVAVLVVACPCALGLATPTALLVGTGRGAQLGIVIRGAQVLEQTRRADTVVLDKTGTVTTGVMTAHDLVTDADGDVADLLARAAAVERASTHPVAAAVVRAYAERAGDPDLGRLPAVSDAREEPGVGAVGVVAGATVRVGRASALGPLPPTLADAVVAAGQRGRTAVVVAVDGRPRLVVAVGDTVKPTSAEAVRLLSEQGLRPVLLTGDHPAPARTVAAEVGIAPEDVVAEVLPADKLAAVERLQAQGRVVAMVGDGVNDAAALTRADLGVAMGTGTHVAQEAADITLVGGDLRAAADAVALSRRTLATIRWNLFWAFAYNVAMIPLAMSGRLSPMLAGAAMAFSSVFVVTNSLRLRTFRPPSARGLRPSTGGPQASAPASTSGSTPASSTVGSSAAGPSCSPAAGGPDPSNSPSGASTT